MIPMHPADMGDKPPFDTVLGLPVVFVDVLETSTLVLGPPPDDWTDMGDRPPIDITAVECPDCGDTGIDPTDDNPDRLCTCPMGRIVARRRERETM